MSSVAIWRTREPSLSDVKTCKVLVVDTYAVGQDDEQVMEAIPDNVCSREEVMMLLVLLHLEWQAIVLFIGWFLG